MTIAHLLMIPSGNLKAIENDPFSSMLIFHSFLYVYQSWLVVFNHLEKY
jgi:hypothetical protein